ncbi:efflux RND transporter periplasmic adaptor subunit [Stieleria sp. TO1_6]|uniref:efflux RND transporter periplasmic adaptor subunit n=1 Tax=Stieleria tagensis TaxID=2956795 RepID=UPI00209A77E7|nr:efflux RND transporter periplasmic adaptor subunit [Stieleria tagensis]MCO8121377.1 efflux RND transporter periplasmic adaptor subunit [Stieleria tagensis]
MATELEGYTEPLRTIEVASDESGTIAELLVQQGQVVTQGQPIMRLNSQVHQAQLQIAKQQMTAAGRLDAARAELELTTQRVEKLQSLRLSGHARQSEIDRAAKELKVAQANFQANTEELETRRLEYERLATQIGRRVIHSPIDGVVTELHKQPGEYVAPISPEIVTLVQIDTLLATFAMIGPHAATLRQGQSIHVSMIESGQSVKGIVSYVAPVTDAESGTVLVKIRIENTEGRYRSGARCTIQIQD